MLKRTIEHEYEHLKAYIARRLREEAANGTNLLPAMVMGDSEEEIEDSIQQAKDAFDNMQTYFVERFKRDARAELLSEMGLAKSAN